VGDCPEAISALEQMIDYQKQGLMSSLIYLYRILKKDDYFSLATKIIIFFYSLKSHSYQENTGISETLL